MKSLQELKDSLKTDVSALIAEDHHLREDCLQTACKTFSSGSALEKTMEYLRLYHSRFTPYICDDLFLAGAGGNFYIKQIDELTTDGGHYCPDFEKLLQVGVVGLSEEIASRTPENEIQKQTQAAFLETLNLFCGYMRKHQEAALQKSTVATGEHKVNLLRIAANIQTICEQKPTTFLQGLQLIWFANCYIHLKPYTNTITLGNLDRTLFHLYQSDIRSGNLTPEIAKEQICHFYLAFETMARDTQNIVLGGSDANGNYFETPLTRLFLQAQTILHLEEPVVSLKIRPDTSDAVWKDALELLEKGGGMPSFLNDSLYIRGLKQEGYTDEEANTFANIGCYEASPYGSSFGSTTCFCWRLPDEFTRFFRDVDDFPDFRSFLNAWHTFLTNRFLKEKLPQLKKQRFETLFYHSACTFSGCLLDGCIETLRLPEQGGAKNNIMGVNLGGLATVVDSILCIKHFVYDTKEWTLDFYKKQISENYPDTDILAKIRRFPNRFGSFESFSTDFAAEEAAFLHDLITKNPLSDNIKSMPALFMFFDDILGAEALSATPDGRRDGERYSYGASASELIPKREIPKILRSTAALPLDLFPDGAPQSINLMPNLAQSKKGKEMIRTTIETYFREGGSHLHINAANPDILKDAQKNPEQYQDLLIRVSGHTEPFIRLTKKLQDALIARTQAGC